MGALSRLVDRMVPPRPELLAAREAHAALWVNCEAEVAAGIDHETPEFLGLNRRANDSVRALSAFERTFRLYGPTSDLLTAREVA